MAFASDKTMFEVYRDNTYSRRFRVVYYTELQDHNKETEISHALAGEHFIDGFLRDYGKEEAKSIIDGLVNRLNGGEPLTPEQFLEALHNHLA